MTKKADSFPRCICSEEAVCIFFVLSGALLSVIWKEVHFFAFYVETKAQIVSGICGAAAVLLVKYLIAMLFKRMVEIFHAEIPEITFRILTKEQLHGFGRMLKIKIGAD